MHHGEPMSGGWKVAVIVLVLAGVAGALVLKQSEGEQVWTPRSEIPFNPATPVPIEPIPPTYESTQPGLPRLVAIGAGECIPCRAMAPIRADLRRDYAGPLVVDFYDVWKDRQAGYHFGMKVIPTLIYYDAAGVELGVLEALSGGLAGAVWADGFARAVAPWPRWDWAWRSVSSSVRAPSRSWRRCSAPAWRWGPRLR
jgi:thiol-disulfide isomerase/thioredoxin